MHICGCSMVFYVLKIFHGCRNQMAAFRAWKSNWVWIICCYVRPGKSVDPCLKIDVVYSEVFFGDVFDDFKGALAWYVHKARFAIGALVFFLGGKANFNKKNKTTWTHLQGVQYMLNYLSRFIERSANCWLVSKKHNRRYRSKFFCFMRKNQFNI